MLVLSRKKNESIVINNDITVTVVEIRGDKVRLGIVAPKEVPVHRQEVFDAIHVCGREGGFFVALAMALHSISCCFSFLARVSRWIPSSLAAFVKLPAVFSMASLMPWLSSSSSVKTGASARISGR